MAVAPLLIVVVPLPLMVPPDQVKLLVIIIVLLPVRVPDDRIKSGMD